MRAGDGWGTKAHQSHERCMFLTPHKEVADDPGPNESGRLWRPRSTAGPRRRTARGGTLHAARPAGRTGAPSWPCVLDCADRVAVGDLRLVPDRGRELLPKVLD